MKEKKLLLMLLFVGATLFTGCSSSTMVDNQGVDSQEDYNSYEKGMDFSINNKYVLVNKNGSKSINENTFPKNIDKYTLTETIFYSEYSVDGISLTYKNNDEEILIFLRMLPEGMYTGTRDSSSYGVTVDRLGNILSYSGEITELPENGKFAYGNGFYTYFSKNYINMIGIAKTNSFNDLSDYTTVESNNKVFKWILKEFPNNDEVFEAFITNTNIEGFQSHENLEISSASYFSNKVSISSSSRGRYNNIEIQIGNECKKENIILDFSKSSVISIPFEDCNLKGGDPVLVLTSKAVFSFN